MTIYIEPDYIKRIEDENEQLKERLKRESFYYEWQNTLDENKQLQDDKRYWLDNFKRLRDDKIKLIEENEQLKEELLQSDYVKASVFSDREEYKKRISKLIDENTKLQDLQDKNAILQQELFNLYLKHYN